MKYTCEIDTEAKTMKFMKDGQEMPVGSCSMGSYSYETDTCNCTYCYASFTQNGSDNSTVTTNIAFEVGGDYSLSNIQSNATTLKEINKAVARLIASDKFSNVLAKKSCKNSMTMDKKCNKNTTDEENTQDGKKCKN